MGDRHRISFRQRLYRMAYRRRTFLRQLVCLRASFHEVYRILNPDAGCRR